MHSDIKPQNLVMTPLGDLKVIDFGISLIGYSEYFATTQLLKVGGTVPYFSPQQFQAYINFVTGKNPHAKVRHNPFKSDVFSLALSFYHMAALRPPLGLNNLSSDLQEKINRGVERIEYGPNVKNLLLHMLCVEESNRPDFLTLRRILY